MSPLDKSLPPSVLALLEGKPARPPAFPEEPTPEDNRILPGGPASALLLTEREKTLREDLESLLEESARGKSRRPGGTECD